MNFMLSIILPTYNESENIIPIIKEIKQNLHDVEHEIIVVDDNSPDLTWDVVRKSHIKGVKCLRRKKKVSLSSAVILGFSRAKYEILVVMDADGQHNPDIIKRMVPHAKNHDIVVGSRFIKGGGVKGWSKKRIIVSKAAASLAMAVTKSKLRDPMSGFFMIKKETFDEIKDDLTGKGYKILLETIMCIENKKKKATIKEVPLVFRLRTKGESKLGLEVIKEYLQMIIKHFLKKFKK